MMAYKDPEKAKAQQKVWREANREKLKAYREANREKLKARLKAWCAANPEKVKAQYQRSKPKRKIRDANRSLCRKYGLTPEQYESMYHAQFGVCGICRKEESGARSLSVDHCHITGKVRALLCNNCNTGIGLLKEDIDLLWKAIAYLERHAT